MSKLISVQGKKYRELCANAKPESDDQRAMVKTHQRAAAANRTNYVIKRACFETLEGMQPGQTKGDQSGSKQKPKDQRPVITSTVKETKETNNKPELSLVEAVRALDPANDDHWTKSGQPAMKAVEALVGSDSVTRDEVEAVAPGFDREAAKAAAE